MSARFLPDGRELVVAVGPGFPPGSDRAVAELGLAAGRAVERAARAFRGAHGDGPRWCGERAARAAAEGVAPAAPRRGGPELAVAAFETGSAVYVVLSAVAPGSPPRRGESRVGPWAAAGAP